MPETNESVVILGATSVMAKAIAREFAARGLNVIVGARDTEENEMLAQDLRVRYEIDAHALFFDVTECASHDDFLDACTELLGTSMRGVVLCSGTMSDQKKAEQDWALSAATLETNFSGPVSILNRFAEYFETQGSGFICAIASVAGDRGRESNYIYGASKGALATYLEGLRNRLFHSDVRVLTVKPGFVDTKMTWGLPGMFLVASPERVGARVVHAIERKRNVIYVPWFWRYIMLTIRSIPEFIFKRLHL